MLQKRLRDGSFLNKSNVALESNQYEATSNTNTCIYGGGAVGHQKSTTPTSPAMSPPATLMKFADFFVDPSNVPPSEAATVAEEMAADFFSEVSIMYDMLSDITAPTAEGRAVNELMRRLRNVLRAIDNRRIDSEGSNLLAQFANVRSLYNGLIRVFIFLYQRYYRTFVVLEVSELLTASWQRLLAFVVEYRILDETFVWKVYDYVAQIIGSLR
ncbi:hypothetical protein CCR75_004257 [Bremia lactucae]|uniref:Uncharacterized protein n=1 Tax=Bremia lactucae TaxID=4779 RepID=A0A976NZB4_BRELC|nr:hypothetical protein CCR75_004257 [Bremia lactucae]